jgi:hypothetical protein
VRLTAAQAAKLVNKEVTGDFTAIHSVQLEFCDEFINWEKPTQILFDARPDVKVEAAREYWKD